VGSEGGELLILGDLFELWQMNLSLMLKKRLVEHLSPTAAAHRPITRIHH